MNYKKIFTFLLLISIFVLTFPISVHAIDLRVIKLKKFFAKYNSPLENEAEIFVFEADKNKIDYRLLPAISGVESTFARNYIDGTFNAYGWGVGKIKFENWKEGISRISIALTQNPYMGTEPKDLAGTYCPPNANKWTHDVQYFMDQIEKIELIDLPVKELQITL